MYILYVRVSYSSMLTSTHFYKLYYNGIYYVNCACARETLYQYIFFSCAVYEIGGKLKLECALIGDFVRDLKSCQETSSRRNFKLMSHAKGVYHKGT